MSPEIRLPGRLGIGVGKRVSAFFDSLDDTLDFFEDMEDIEEGDEDLEVEDEGDEDTAEVVEGEEEEVPTPVISVIASKVFGDRSDHVEEPEEMMSSLARDEPEDEDGDADVEGEEEGEGA